MSQPTRQAAPVDARYTASSDRTGQPTDAEAMQAQHAKRLVVARGALPPDFDAINDYQKHVKREISRGGMPDWNPEVVALGRVIDHNPFVRMYCEQMLAE